MDRWRGGCVVEGTQPRVGSTQADKWKEVREGAERVEEMMEVGVRVVPSMEGVREAIQKAGV